MATIEVIHGDMFEGASDLLLVPCSHWPTVSDFVESRLANFDIPVPRRPIKPGNVSFVDLPARSSSVARVVGYVASVDKVGSTPAGIIESIGRVVAEYCSGHPEISAVNSPLLGTGAGGLYPVVSATAMAKGFLQAAPDGVELRLFVLHADQFALIGEAVKDGSRSLSPAKRPVRVFVSYTGSGGEAHADWVKGLATRLRRDGINARLDEWHLARGMDLPQWMCNELHQADRVLLICDEFYSDKSDGRHGGVGWEVRVLQGELMDSQAENPDKVIPIVVSNDRNTGTPGFLKGAYAFHWPGRDERSEYNELLKALYRAQESAPPIGRTPSFVLAALANSVGD